MAEVALFIVGDTHSGDSGVHLWGWRVKKKKNVTTLKKCEKPFWIKMAFVWVAQPRWPATQALAYTTCAQHNSTKVQTLSEPSNTCWVQSLQHMRQRPQTDVLSWCSWSRQYKYTTRTSFKLPIIQWKWGCRDAAEVSLDKTEHHMLYIHRI